MTSYELAKSFLRPNISLWESHALTIAFTAVLAAASAHFALKYHARVVETLKGILPICAHCKRIRDGMGRWQQLESNISQKSSAKFSHGICPECEKKYYDQA